MTITYAITLDGDSPPESIRRELSNYILKVGVTAKPTDSPLLSGAYFFGRIGESVEYGIDRTLEDAERWNHGHPLSGIGLWTITITEK